MNPIIPPLKFSERGNAVGNLQDALLLLLDKGSIQTSEEERKFLIELLRREQAKPVYDDGTRRTIELFQEQRRLQISGEVDEPTANALNALLRDLGQLGPIDGGGERQRVVSGRVSRSDQQAFSGLVRAFHEAERGAVRLGEDKIDAEGNYTIRYAPLPDANVINLRVSVLDETGRTVNSADTVRDAGPLQVIDLVVPFVQSATATRQVEGRIVFDHGAPAEDLTLRLYRLGFGGAEGATRLAEITTGEHGLYSLPYTADGLTANIEVRAVDAAGKEVSLSKIIKNAGEREVLNLVAPGQARPLAAEFARLENDLQPHVGDLSRLRNARENAEQQDLTLLYEATGWDARLIATAAMATRLSTTEETGLPQDALYGLLRVGLPNDKLQLARVSAEAFDQALGKAQAAGIVSLSEARAAEVKQSFETFSVNTRLAVQAPGSVATYGDLLKKLDLSENDQQTFAKLYLNHRGDAVSLWEQAANAGLSAVVPKLQKQGKLAFLTTNDPDLTATLQSKLGDAGPEQLVKMGLYKKENWLGLIGAVPAAFGNSANPKTPYAEDMARKVRISYSTEVTWNMIETGELNFEGGNANLSAFLKNAIDKGFKLGETPIGTFISANPDVFNGIAVADRPITIEQVKTLQRVYQITPSNEAIKPLLDKGLLSAQDVLAYSLDVFLEQFGPLFPSEEQARLVYRKAEQVSNITYSLFSLAKELDSAPPIFAMSATSEVRQEAKSKLIKHFPTMESLFGSLDFCECEHCRSVLSPAAYLVDLLQFLDREPAIWANTLKDWEKKHGTAPYPFKNRTVFDTFIAQWHIDQPGEPDPNTKRTPYEILIERRPDLPHIPLTCENTNTALPQIDLVNEILEYYVANNALKADAARDTGDATTAELLAEPQHVIAEAYTALQQARYPLALPFDLWIETARQFTAYFDVPLWRLLEVFRKREDLFAPTEAYDRAAIFFESLGLSAAEVAIFTNPDPLPNWFELYGFAKEKDALTEAVDANTGQRIDLNSAKALSRRLAVSYKELVEIVGAGFVNPTLEALVTLHKLEIDTTDVFFYQQHKHLLNDDEKTLAQKDREHLADVRGFEQRLDALTAKFNEAGGGFNARVWLQTALDDNSFDTILVLADPDAGCNFDLTTLRYANGDKADAFAFLKINLFVRLWRKLGWSIEETDRALQTFVPKGTPFDKDNLKMSPLKTALIYIAHLKALEAQVQLGKDTRLKLLTLWAPLPTAGKNPLYAQLFLKRNILKSDPVFDHPLGLYLSDVDVLAKDHLLALRSALGLTADDIALILKDDGQDMATAPLLLSNASLLYRYALLGKALRLSIADLISLKEMANLNPFKAPSSNPLTQLQDDHPFTNTLGFIEVAAQINTSGLTIANLNYLFRHRFDPVGKYRQNDEATLALTQTLANGIVNIRSEHALPEDPGSLTDDALRQKLGLVLSPDVVETFLAMLAGTVEYTATQGSVQLADRLNPASFAVTSAIQQVSYNETRKEQKLTLRGVLFDTQKDQLKAQFPTPLVSALLDDVQAQARAFFRKHLEKQSLSATANIGILDSADFDFLFQAVPDALTEAQKQARQHTQRARLANTFIPFLQQQLIRQLVVQTLQASTGADTALIESLLVDKTLLADPTQNTQPLLNAFAAVGERGLSATFFASADGTGAPLVSLILADADTMLKDGAGSPLKPPGTNSVRIEGYLEVPIAGAYRFYAALSKKNAKAELRFAHLPVPLFSDTALTDVAEISEFVELKPGVPYRFTLDLHQLSGGDAQLLVQSETLSKDRLARLSLYPEASVQRIRRAQVRLAKALQLLQALGLNERELRYIATHSADFDGVSLSELPTQKSDDTPAQATKLFQQFLRLATYVRLKRELVGGGDDLIGVFEATTLDDAYARIALITRREKDVVKAAAEVLLPTPGFSSEQSLIRLWEGLQLVEQFGVPVVSMSSWTQIAKAPVTPADHKKRVVIAHDLKDAIKSRFEPQTWQRVAQPIFDKLRQRQRDALVAHVMHQHGFDRIEQLFEFFLIDPGAEPVLQTSRIRAATAAVQIFIHRCLLNLEPQVAPSAINSKQWQWMKRYPVWAGNRKLWLFPENVLEPEFRDDKTHLFTELEGKLLQGDVTNDLVEDAFFSYLKKLDELARLDIVAMYCEESELDPASNRLHVIGRTYSEPHKYFYRRYAHQMWTPWEPMPVEIDGDHIVPVVWRDRLNVFWVTFLDRADQNSGPVDDDSLGRVLAITDYATQKEVGRAELPVNQNKGGKGNAKPKTIAEMSLGQLAGGLRSAMRTKLVDVQLHWSEYFQGEWSVRESGGYSASLTGTVPLSFDRTKVFIHATKEYDKETAEERGVKIHLGGEINQAFSVVSRNSRPTCANREPAPAMPYTAPDISSNRYAGDGAFKVTFKQRIETEIGKPPKPPTIVTPNILQQGGKFTLLPCANTLTLGTEEIASLVSPIFYQDDQSNTFYIEPRFKEKTIEEWDEWVTRTPEPEVEWDRPDWWGKLTLEALVPDQRVPVPVNPGDPIWKTQIDPRARFEMASKQDWLANTATVMQFDDELIGPTGRAGLAVRTSLESEGTTAINVNAGSAVASGSTVVVIDSSALASAGLAHTVGGLNVIGGNGLNSALLKNMNAVKGF